MSRKDIGVPLHNRTRLRSVRLKYAFALGCIAAAGLSLARPALADDLPRQAAPAGFHSQDNAGGGRILAGTLPDAHSGTEAFHASLHRLKSYFGSSLEVTSAVTSPDNQIKAAFFHAKLHGTPVTGMSLVTIAPDESAHEVILFDVTARFTKSLPSLFDSLKTMPAAIEPQPVGAGRIAHAAAAVPSLHEHEAEDRTVGISIPSDWQVKFLQSGMVIVAGPDKERVAMNVHFTFLDPHSQRVRNAVGTARMTHTQVVLPGPVASFSENVADAYVSGVEAIALQQKEPDPHVLITSSTPAGQGMAFIAGTKVESGVTMMFSGLASATSVGNGAWSLAWWMVFDTPDGIKRSAPTLLAIYKSLTYNGAVDLQVKRAETDIIVGSIKDAMKTSKEEHDTFTDEQNQRFERSQAAAREAQDNIERTGVGWVHVIQGMAVMEHTDTGARGTIDANLGDAISQSFPDHFRIVPISEYRKGIDF